MQQHGMTTPAAATMQTAAQEIANAPRRAWRPGIWFQATLLLLLAVCAFLGSWLNQYSYDDIPLIPGNPDVQSLAHWPRLFLQSYWHNIDTGGLYRPVTMLSFALGWHFRPNDPTAYHAANIALHGLTAVLVMLLARGWLSDGASFAAGAWFALTPLHVEVVAGLVGRSEILSTLFMLIALLCAWRAFEETQAAASWGWGLATACSTLLALGSKETAIATLALVPLLQFCRPGARDGRRGSGWREGLGRPVVWLTALSGAGYMAVRWHVAGLLTGTIRFEVNPLAFAGVAGRVRTALWISGLNLWAMVWPFHLSPDYSYDQIPVILRWSDPHFVLAVLLWGAVCAWLLVAVAGYGRRGAVLFGAAVMVLTYLPVSNLLVPIGTIRAIRLLYAPSVGAALLLGVAWQGVSTRLPARRMRAALLVPVFILGAVYALSDWRESAYWEDNGTLFSLGVRRAPRSSHMHAARSAALFEVGRMDEGIAELQTAVALDPRYPQAWGRLADVLEHRGRSVEARHAYHQALRLEPTADLCRRLLQMDLAASRAADVLADQPFCKPPLNPEAIAAIQQAHARLKPAATASALPRP